jgi:hypothetical protein
VIRNRNRLLGGLVAVAALLGLHAQEAHAQALDMAGSWTLTVESQNGVTNPTLTLQQSGTSLTGHYSSDTLGEQDVVGDVQGRTATVTFSAVIEGLGAAPLSYSGEVAADGTWSGELTADIQGQMFPIGTFTATKS